MRILRDVPPRNRRARDPRLRSEGRTRRPAGGDRRCDRFVTPVPQIAEDAMLHIVKPTKGEAIRTLMSGTSWTPNAAYVSVRNRRTIPTEAATALLAAQVDEVDISTVRSWAEPMRIELHTSEGRWSTIVDRARQKDDGRLQLCELKSDWAGFATPRAQVQERLGRLAAGALGAEYVREVPASLGSPTLRKNAILIQCRRFVPVPLRCGYVAADMFDRLGTVSLGRLADALAPNRANGRALICSMMVQRLVAIDLEVPLGDDSCVRAVPPLPEHMPGLFDLLIRQRPHLHHAA